jgi:hypothetical protein
MLLCGCASSAPQKSEYNLGVEAFGIKDYASARQHWAKAIKDGGEIEAKNNLGYLLYFGLGGETDRTQAVSLWTAAAQSGGRESQWHLGQAFEEGKAMEKDVVKAYAWYRCAAGGLPSTADDDDIESKIAQDARRSLIELLPRLSPSEFDSAEKLAKLYIANYSKATTH